MISDSIEYRFAEIKDVEQLIRLRARMQVEANDYKTEVITDEFTEKARAYFLKAIPSGTYYSSIAIVNEKIIGTAGVCFYEKPPPLSGGTGLIGYVTNVFVEKDFRKKGIATRMMRELTRLAQELKADKLHLGTTKDGFSIYKSVGYQEPRSKNLELRFPFNRK